RSIARDDGDLSALRQRNQRLTVGLGAVHAVDQRGLRQPVRPIPRLHDRRGGDEMIEQAPAARMAEPVSTMSSEQFEDRRRGGVAQIELCWAELRLMRALIDRGAR